MSWSVSTPKVIHQAADEHIDKLLQTLRSTQKISDEVAKQVKAAQEAAKVLVKTMAVPHAFVIVSFTGHKASGEEGAFDGWRSADVINISVSQYFDVRD